MIRGTTPTLTLTVDDTGTDFQYADSVYVTIKQGDNIITKTGTDLSVSGQSVSCWLTETESLSLKENAEAFVQVNWTYTEGGGTVKRAATNVQSIHIGYQLMSEEITA